jgi:hypothetical protein
VALDRRNSGRFPYSGTVLSSRIKAAQSALVQVRAAAAQGGEPNRDGRSILRGRVIELWRFMRVRKKLWPLPVLIMMVVFGGLMVLTKGSAVAPIIYTLF